MAILTSKDRDRNWPALLAGLAVGVACVLGAAFLTNRVAEELSLLNTANSDNIQWTLSQVEVEFLEFDAVVASVDAGQSDDLSLVRRKFDVFFSRIATVSTGKLYGELRGNEATAKALEKLDSFLDDIVADIDSSDAVLRQALPQIHERSNALRGDVRRLTNSGLAFFASQSDQRREDVALTLALLAIVVVTLIGMLAALVVYLYRINARRLERQKEILEVNARINTIISTSLDAVIVTDQTGKILEFNPAAEEIFGHTAIETIGHNIVDIVVPPHLADQHIAGMERMRLNGERRFVGQGRTQLEAIRRNNEVFPIELALQSARTDAGELFIAFIRDISAMVAAEKELVSTRDRALAGDKAKSEFLAVMSHEIRTPLNGLLGNLALLEDTDLSEAQVNYLRNMETSGRLLLSHVTDVLDITRYEAGSIERRLQPVELALLLQDMVDSQSAQAEGRNTKLSWTWVGPPVSVVKTDPDLLQPILLNLISNAVKFTRKGTVAVEVENISGTELRPEIEFRVIDDGIGMSEDMVARAFDDFVTGSSAYNRETGGSGLGLGIAKRFVTSLGGDIGCESEPGGGSLFWVRLPFDAVDAAPLVVSDRQSPQAKALDVLVIEDNAINRQVVREMLTALGHSVQEAPDGQAGVALADARKFDLILMDISMPILDGEEATHAIRSGGGLSSDSPIVALTAHVKQGDKERFLDGGMTDILSKPLSKRSLTSLLRSLGNGTTQASPRKDAARDAATIDLEQLAEIEEAMGYEGYREMIDLFLMEGDEFIHWIQTETAPPNSFMAEKAHKFSGSSAVFGAKVMHAELKHLEAMAEGADGPAIAKTVSRLPKTWSQTKAAIRAVGMT